MSSSSQQPDSSITLNDTYTIDVSNLSYSSSDTITISGYSPCTVSYPSHYSGMSTLTTTQISGLTTAQLGSITSIDSSAFKINFPEEWVDCLPDFNRIEKMCEEYPGLKIAYEKFKTVYKLVKDDYDTPKDKRLKP
jgi:hypothetical protein